MAEPIVRIDGITKTFSSWRGAVTAVSDLSLTIERGSVVAFVGPNGAGKTTTIYAMLGLLRPERGTVSLFGEPAGSRAARQRLGFLSEIFYTYPFRTAREAMAFYGALSGLTPDVLGRRIPGALTRAGLDEAIDRRVGTFSKGMVQRLGLAQALLHQPELLLLDEPTTGLDPEGRKLVADVIAAEKARGTTVFLSSHILADIERICDHVVMIRRGRIALSTSIASLGTGRDEWEIEVDGWQPGHAAEVAAAGGTVVHDGAGAALVRCATDRKEALLARLIALGLRIGAVRGGRKSLEELYMEHVGGSSDG